MRLDRRVWIPLLVVGVALTARLLMMLTSVYLWDEDREWIRLANTISIDHLPLRGVTHPILPAYFIHLGSVLFGASFVGFRAFSVLAGVGTVLAGYWIVERRAGALGGAVAAAALALNEYHVMVSSVAVDMVFYLLFSILALGAFLRFLEEPRSSWLLWTGLLSGLGFLCNERAGLLVPLWCTALLLTGNARWLARWPTWAALCIFVACFLAAKTQAGSGGQLDRFAGFGVTAQPLAFYGKSAVRKLLSFVHTGFKDWAPEYPSMNAVLGASLLAGTALALVFKRLRDDAAVRTCLALFAIVMTLLVFVNTRYSEEANLAPQAWYWADLSLLPAALLAGIAAGRGGLTGRAVAVGVLAGALVGAVHIGGTRLGTTTVQGGAVPGLISPADGRMAELRTAFLTCATCPRDPAVALKKVEVRQEGGDWRAATPDEAVAHDPGGRGLALRAAPGNVYALWYDVGGRELAFDVVVRDAPSRYPPPFWLEAATARGAPSPPRAGGS